MLAEEPAEGCGRREKTADMTPRSSARDLPGSGRPSLLSAKTGGNTKKLPVSCAVCRKRRSCVSGRFRFRRETDPGDDTGTLEANLVRSLRPDRMIRSHRGDGQIGTCIAIELPFNHNYLEAAVCLPQRCHVHVWCGGEVSWIMAVRMGGQVPHLGLLLTEGALGSYSIRRSLTESHCVSNTRGVFLLHPESFALAPGECRTIRWQLFRHDGSEDFIRILRSRLGRLWIESEQWVAFRGESVRRTGGKLDQSILLNG